MRHRKGASTLTDGTAATSAGGGGRAVGPRSARLGAALAVGSGLAYSVTVVVGRSLADHRISSATALGSRFTLAAAVLIVLQLLRGDPIVPERGERLAAFLLGAIGYGIESTCFYSGLERGSAAAVGLLFYSYPAVVMVIELATGELEAAPQLFVALALSITGVVAVVATGGRVTITPTGAVFACAASLAFSGYFLAGHRFIRRTSPPVVAVWVSAGAAASMIGRGLLTGSLHRPHGVWVQLAGYAVANCFAFAFMFAALRHLGPSRTAVLLTVEVFGTVTLAAIFLGETLRPLQLAGGAAIAAGALLATRAQARVDNLEPAPP